MMRPVTLALPPIKPSGLTFTTTGTGNNRRIVVSWTDNSITETDFQVQRSTNGTTWTTVGTLAQPLVGNTHGTRSFTDPSSTVNTGYRYRVVARNTVGYGGAFPSLTVQSISDVATANAPAAPTALAAGVLSTPGARLTWTDNATNETGYVVQRSTDGTTWTQVGTGAANLRAFNDTTVTVGTTYSYRVGAVNGAGTTLSTPVTVTVSAPSAPSGVTATAALSGAQERLTVNWQDLNNEARYTVQWSVNAIAVRGSATVAANGTTFTTGLLNRQVWYVRVGATNPLGTTWSGWVQVPAA